jgi:hypothetical protein
MENQNQELGWDDAIEKDSADWVLLPPGDYPFCVKSFTRARFAGGAKLPACPQAKLELEVGGPEESTTIKHNLFLHKKTEGLLCQFFASIGERKHGERLVMNWPGTIGRSGMCRVAVRDYKKKDGTDGQSNEITKFLDPVATEPAPDDLNF